MASDQVEQLINDVTGIADIDPALGRMFVRDAGRRTLEVRHWSFLYRRNQLSVPAAVSSITLGATATTSTNSTTIAFSAPIATPSMTGQQLRFSSSTNVIGAAGPVFDITGYTDPSHIEIWPPYGLTGAALLPFTIFTAFFQLPADFMMFDSVVDPVYRRRLRTNVSQQALNGWDAGRSRLGGPASILAPLDYSPTSVGTLSSIIQAVGTGPRPAVSGDYSGQSDAIFVVRIDGAGAGGVATFTWSKNEVVGAAAVVTDTGVGNLLSDSVSLVWNAAAVYVLGDTFVVRASATPTIGVPRVELYPYQSSPLVFPFTYIARFPDITDDGVTLPGIIGRRDDVIREKALEMAATYPGTPDRPNNYAQINRRDYHAANWRALVTELDREDNETRQTNVRTDPYAALPFATLPWMSGSDLQSFDPPWIYPDWPGYM